MHQGCYNKSESQTVRLVVFSASGGSVHNRNRTVVLRRERIKFTGLAQGKKEEELPFKNSSTLTAVHMNQ